MVKVLWLLVCALAILAALGVEIIGFSFYRPVALEPRFVYMATFAAGVLAFFSILVGTKGLEIEEPVGPQDEERFPFGKCLEPLDFENYVRSRMSDSDKHYMLNHSVHCRICKDRLDRIDSEQERILRYEQRNPVGF